MSFSSFSTSFHRHPWGPRKCWTLSRFLSFAEWSNQPLEKSNPKMLARSRGYKRCKSLKKNYNCYYNEISQVRMAFNENQTHEPSTSLVQNSTKGLPPLYLYIITDPYQIPLFSLCIISTIAASTFYQREDLV